MSDQSPFGKFEEQAIISLILDFPEMYTGLARFLKPDLFEDVAAQYIIASIHQDYEQHSVVPSRGLLADRLSRTLTADDPHDEVLELINRQSNPRDVPMIRAHLQEWVRHKTYDLLYSDEALEAHHRGDHEFLDKIVEDASKINNLGQQGFWFFDQIEEIFAEHAIDHIKTGFPGLDEVLHNGGPSKKEVIVWLAPTGVGKTLMLCNNAVQGIRQGLNVLFVTFELSTLKTAMRIAGAMSKVAINKFINDDPDHSTDAQLKEFTKYQSDVKRRIGSNKKADLVIYELPPDECSVNEIYSIIDNNKKMRNWKPDIVILDYLELMVSRRSSSNDSDYTRQKSVANEVRGLAKNEDVLVYTATQTNRQGLDGRGHEAAQANIDLAKTAESYGKTMPVDYVISLNQSEEEYNRYDPERNTPAQVRLWIAKNRNGPRAVSITAEVFYSRMEIRQVIGG